MHISDIDYQEERLYNKADIKNIVSNAVSAALEKYQEQCQVNLENTIKPSFSINAEGEDSMGSKFREKVLVETKEDGSQNYIWVSASTKNELHREIAKALSVDSVDLPKQMNTAPLWEDCVSEWFEVFHKPKLRPKTLIKDESMMRLHVRPAFLGRQINTITTSELQKYLESKKHMSRSIVRDIMWMLRKVFASAVEDGYMLKNPMNSERIHNPSIKPEQPRRALGADEQADIISHINDIKNVSDRRFMAFLMYTGMRPCEIYGLKWEDIDVNGMTIFIQRDVTFASGLSYIGDTKTEQSKRHIPISQDLLEYLKPIEKEGFVFHMKVKGREDEPVSERTAQLMWRRIKKDIDVHGMTPYMGRHTYATNMNKAGVSLRTAMSMMGHADERMLLRRYTHTDEQDKINANLMVTNYLSALSGKNSQ